MSWTRDPPFPSRDGAAPPPGRSAAPPGGGHPLAPALTEAVPLRRVAAWVVDLLILAALCATLWVAIGIFGVLTLGFGLTLLGVLPAVPVLYHLGFLLAPGAATPGQALLGLTVRRSEDLAPPTAQQAIIFTVGLYLTLMAGAVWLVVALFTENRRALHDLVSGLVVVRRAALWDLHPGLAGAPGADPLTPGGAGWNNAGRFPHA